MTIEDIFGNLPTLLTERMILRKIRMDDAEDIFAYASNPEVAEHVSWNTHSSIESSRTFISAVIEQYENGLVAPWGIIDKKTGHLIGTCGFLYWSIEHARAEIGYALARHRWGQGYMTEATLTMIAFGFEQMRLNRIEARCYVENIGSARVMEKSGMSFEGTLREQMLVKGDYRTLKMYSILRSEWEAGGEAE